MYLNDLREPTNVTVCVKKGNNVVELTTNIVNISDKKDYDYIENSIPVYRKCIVNAMRQNGLLLSFVSNELRYSATTVVEDKAYEWSGIDIKTIKTPSGNAYHVLLAPNEARIKNRRSGFRVWLGNTGKVITKPGLPPIDVTVKDLSSTGIAFIAGPSDGMSLGQIVNIKFTDNTGMSFILGATIVRTEELETKDKVYGCKLNQHSAILDKYIAEKQLDQRRSQRKKAMR